MNRTKQIIKYLKQGKTHQQIGDQFGLSKQRVNQLVKKYEIHLAIEKTAIAMRKEGFDYDAIIEYLEELYPKNTVKELYRKITAMKKYIELWCAKESMPYKLPPYNYQQEDNKL